MGAGARSRPRRRWSRSSTPCGRRGYAVFGLTGRGARQEDATLTNLSTLGYTGVHQRQLLHQVGRPRPHAAGATSRCVVRQPCTTVEYKANTRKHIEQDLGYDIALNVGDQWSDLQGGYADATLKLPNPTYYLPSPDIAGAPAERRLADAAGPASRCDPTARAGAARAVRASPTSTRSRPTIRTYYDATDGIADKASLALHRAARHAHRDVGTPGALQLPSYTKPKHGKQRTARSCFDADDTTLWTYDMEDAAMKFNFDPALQDVWVQDQRFPATPMMKRVVRAAERAAAASSASPAATTASAERRSRTSTSCTARTRSSRASTSRSGPAPAPSQQPSYITCKDGEVHDGRVQVADPQARRSATSA